MHLCSFEFSPWLTLLSNTSPLNGKKQVKETCHRRPKCFLLHKKMCVTPSSSVVMMALFRENQGGDAHQQEVVTVTAAVWKTSSALE